MSNVWIIADTHFGHSNIVRGTSKWDDLSGCRDFDTLEEHNNAIVDGINNHIAKDDILYHLGDWSFGGKGNVWNFRKRVVCENICLCLGNHDKHIEKNKELPNVLEKVIQSEQGKIQTTFMDFPREDGRLIASNIPVYARSLFNRVDYTIETSVDKTFNIEVDNHVNNRSLFLSHYSHRVWNGSHRGVIHLYGHSHGSLPGLGKSMDVGVDVAYKIFGEYRPFNIKEIFEIMKDKKVHFTDHHNEKTNWK